MSTQLNLQSKLDQLQKTFLEQAPDEVVAVIRESMKLLSSSGMIEKAIKTGDLAPDFTLQTANGKQVTLGEAVAKGPVILIFYRGGWCPFCQLQLKSLQETLPEFEEMGASLIAVSPQTPAASMATARKLNLTFDILSDHGNMVAHEYGLVWTVGEPQRKVGAMMGIDLPKSNGDSSFELPIPAAYIIDHDRIIRYSFLDTDYTKRMDPVSIIDQIMQVVS